MIDIRTPASEYDAADGDVEAVDLVARTILDGLVAEGDARGTDWDPLVAELPAEQRALAILWWAGAEIDDGGFWQLYTNSTGYHAPELPGAARLAGSERLAELFEEANAAFGGEIPRGRDEREAALQRRFPDEDDEPMEELDKRYYAFDASGDGGTVALLRAFVESNRERFLAG